MRMLVLLALAGHGVGFGLLPKGFERSVFVTSRFFAAKHSASPLRSVDRLEVQIQQTQAKLDRCRSCEECAIAEANTLRDHLNAFVKARGVNGLVQSMSSNASSLRSRLHAMVRRRRECMSIAERRRREAAAHQNTLTALEEQVRAKREVVDGVCPS